MRPRDAITRALSPEGSPRTPVVIPYEGIYIRDHWSALTSRPWWHLFAPDVETQAAWRAEVMQSIGQDWFYLPDCPSAERRERLRVVERGDRVLLVDVAAGTERPLARPAVGGWSARGVESHHPERTPLTREDVDALLPVPTGDPGQVLHDGHADLASALLAGAGADLYPLRHVSAPLWGCYSLWGFEGLMVAVAERPDLVAYACERLLQRAIHDVLRSAALGAAGIWIEDCFTDLVSPPAFERLNLPYLARLVEAIHSAGLQAIYYYCGDPSSRWDALLATGADALSLEESKKGFQIDVEEVVSRAGGRTAVLGNLDALDLLPHAPEEALAAEIARHAAAGRRNGGRFVLSLGSPVTPGTTPERVRLYCRLAHAVDRS